PGSEDYELAAVEGLGVAARRTAFHAAQAGEPAECSLVEPIPRALAAEMSHQQLDLAFHDSLVQRHVDVRPAQVAIPFRDLVFQDGVVAESIPGQPVRLPMVLMSVVAVMGEDQVGFDATLETFKPCLYLGAVARKETVAELVHLDARTIDP